jgi:hypothetical protein
MERRKNLGRTPVPKSRTKRVMHEFSEFQHLRSEYATGMAPPKLHRRCCRC